MNWLREAVTTKQTNWVSSKRVALLIAAVSLAIATLILAVAAYFGKDVGVAITATATCLAGLGGFTYSFDKANARKQGEDV